MHTREIFPKYLGKSNQILNCNYPFYILICAPNGIQFVCQIKWKSVITIFFPIDLASNGIQFVCQINWEKCNLKKKIRLICASNGIQFAKSIGAV